MTGPIILWLSRHRPSPRQLAELKRLFPGCLVKEDRRTFVNADTIVERFHKSGAAEMVVVAPLSFVRELVRRGLHPIWAEMRQIARGSPNADSYYNGRSYRFIKFRRIRKVTVELEEISPPATPQPPTSPPAPSAAHDEAATLMDQPKEPVTS